LICSHTLFVLPAACPGLGETGGSSRGCCEAELVLEGIGLLVPVDLIFLSGLLVEETLNAVLAMIALVIGGV
jgi:hypothetical protein